MVALSLEERIKAVEDYIQNILPRLQAVELAQNAIKDNTEEILAWIKGAQTVWGFTSRHWASALKVVTGFALATGYMSPRVHDLISHIFWLPG